MQYERALGFEWERNIRYGHSINFPLVLSMVGNDSAVEHGRQMCSEMLRALELFAIEFGDVDRMKQVLAPLWTQPWDDQPVFWSVLAHCHIALDLKARGHSVLAFESPTGFGNKTADILFRTSSGTEVLQDIEIWNAPAGATCDDLQRTIRERATTKALAKFGTTEPTNACMITQVAMLSDDVLPLIHSNPAVMQPFMLSHNLGVELCAFAGVGDKLGRQIGYDFLTMRSPLRPLQPLRNKKAPGEPGASS